MAKIVIGTPNYTGDMTSDVAVAMSRCIQAWSKKHEIYWVVIKRTFICKARSMIVHEAAKLNADYLLWIDDDAIVEVDTLEKLLEADKDIIMVPYPLRRPPYQCGVLRSRTGNYEDQGQYTTLDWETELNKGVVEVDGGGTHCMLTKMDVYRTIAYPWFVLAPQGGTEDMYFCLMAKRRGYKVYCHTDLRSGHVGWAEVLTEGNHIAWKRKFGMQDMEEVLEKQPEGLRYIDVGAVESSEAMPITASTLDANAAVKNGPGQAISDR